MSGPDTGEINEGAEVVADGEKSNWLSGGETSAGNPKDRSVLTRVDEARGAYASFLQEQRKDPDSKPQISEAAKLGKELSKAESSVGGVCDKQWQRQDVTKKLKAYDSLMGELIGESGDTGPEVKAVKAAKFVQETGMASRSWEDANNVLKANPSVTPSVTNSLTRSMESQIIHQGPLELRIGGAAEVLDVLLTGDNVPQGPDTEKLKSWQSHLRGADMLRDFSGLDQNLLDQTRSGALTLDTAGAERLKKAKELVRGVSGVDVDISESDTNIGVDTTRLGEMLAETAHGEEAASNPDLRQEVEGAVIGYAEAFLKSGGSADSAVGILGKIGGDEKSIFDVVNGSTDMQETQRKQLERVVSGNYALRTAMTDQHRKVLQSNS